MKKPITFYLTVESYSAMKDLCQKLGVSISNKLDELIKAWIEQQTGQKFMENPVDYEALKREFLKIVKEEEALKKRLMREKVYEDVKRTVLKAGIDIKDFANVHEKREAFLKEWKGRKDLGHLALTLLETLQRKHEVERQLDQIRMGMG